MMSADTLFKGRIVVAIPHSDDEILGCGEALAQIVDKRRVRFVYAADGALSPVPTGRVRRPNPSLTTRRREEAARALGSLGYPDDSLVFLDIPDGMLQQHQSRLDAAIGDVCREFEATTLLAPFRFDWHPDHLAVHRAAAAAAAGGTKAPRLFEYFVYFRYRMLPRGDLRACVRREHLLSIHAPESAAAKRQALDHYATQRELIFPWQTRPVLVGSLLDDLVAKPEYYFDSRAAASRPVFTIPQSGIRVIQAVEPALKAVKDRLTQYRVNA
jgi:LmbE family N-acetylglucosaminyl deacetylase